MSTIGRLGSSRNGSGACSSATPGIESHGPVIQELDRLTTNDWLPGSKPSSRESFTHYLAPQTSGSWRPAPRREFVRPVPIVCSHDPPNPDLPSRAPPLASVSV